MTILETNRLVLRQFSSTDIKLMIKLFTDRQVMEFSDGVKTVEEITEWMDNQIQCFESCRGIAVLAVQQRCNSELIGYCGLSQMLFDNAITEIEIGYRLLRAFWGFGFATEAAIAVRNYGFLTLNLPRLVSLIDPSNHRSIGVALKLGMKFEKEIMMPGYDHADHLYSTSKYKQVES